MGKSSLSSVKFGRVPTEDFESPRKSAW